MSIDKIISQAVARAVKQLYNVEENPENISVQATRKEFEGNLTVVVFPWVKVARKSPEAVGTEIGQWLIDNEPAVNMFNVVKGFLNITIEPRFWDTVLAAIDNPPPYGITAIIFSASLSRKFLKHAATK